MTRVGQILRKQFVDGLSYDLDHHETVILVSYSAMDSNVIGTLRKIIVKSGAKMVVSKNRIASLVLKNSGNDDLAKNIGEQTAFIVSNNDSLELSKILVDFAKDYERFQVKGGLQEGRILDQADFIHLSSLPSKDVLQAQLLGIIQAPVTRLMGALNAKTRDLLSILKQYSEKMGG